MFYFQINANIKDCLHKNLRNQKEAHIALS